MSQPVTWSEVEALEEKEELGLWDSEDEIEVCVAAHPRLPPLKLLVLVNFDTHWKVGEEDDIFGEKTDPLGIVCVFFSLSSLSLSHFIFFLFRAKSALVLQELVWYDSKA